MEHADGLADGGDEDRVYQAACNRTGVIEDVVAETRAEGIDGFAVTVLMQHLSEFETDLTR